ncbi:hypothetical protein J3B02_005843 [Coemansia erecta]|nr:hypothetical protein J3B02_005843 [Coemansia erecta]KAJ2860292.1 hypothetical protein FB639_005654 [Coemansia asiatica]
MAITTAAVPVAVQPPMLTTAAAATPATLAESPAPMVSTETSMTETPAMTATDSHTTMDTGSGAGTEAPDAVAVAVADADTAMVVDSVSSPQASARNPHIESVSADLLASSTSAPCSRVQSPVAVSSSGMSTPKKRTQANKGRCFECRARVPLVKQTTNKCRCGYVFCDSHRFYDQHNCEFDFISSDRKVLEKRNPKLNELPKGGRSFNRID